MRLWQAYYVRAIFLGVVAGQLALASYTDLKLPFKEDVELDEVIPEGLFEDILKIMAKRIPDLKECFTLERFHNFTLEDHGITYGYGAQLLTTIISDKQCIEGRVIPSEDFDLTLVIQSLRKLGYKGCHEIKSCFNEFTLRNSNASAIDLIRNICQKQCLLPEKAYFDVEYLNDFKDSNGKASRSGFKEFLNRIGMSQDPSADHGEDDEEEEKEDYKMDDSKNNPTKKMNGEQNRKSGDHREHTDDRSSNQKNNHNEMISDDEISNQDVPDEPEPINHDGVNNDDTRNPDEDENPDNGLRNSSGGKNTIPEEPFINTADIADEDNEKGGAKEKDEGAENHKNADVKEGLDDANEHEAIDIIANLIRGAGLAVDTDGSINSQNDPAEAATSEMPDAEAGNSEELNRSDNGDELSNHAHRRRKRSSHSTKESRCYTSDQLMDIFEIDDVISDDQAMEICPALIHQLKSQSCKSSHHDHHPYKKNKSGYTEAMVYGYGTISVAIISLLALLGLALFPILESTTYKIIMQFFVGLAVGTLSSDALIHIIPQVLGVHRHESHDDHTDEEYEEDKLFIWKMSVIFGGLYVVAGFESFLRAIKKSRSLRKRKGERNSYQETPGIDNIPNESGPDNAVTSFSCDVVSRESLPKKDPKLSMCNSEQMLLRQEIICCNFTPTLITVFIGDVLHNFADGLAIGVAFASHWSTGISTSIAILCHELPHEIGDFAIYLRNGASKWKAIGLNFTAACCNFIGLYSGINMASDEEVRRWLLCVIAGIFLYISLVQVMSTMLKDLCQRPVLQVLIQNIGMLLGWGIMLLIALFEDQIRIGT